MQGLTYLKRFKKKESKNHWPYILIILALYSLALWFYAKGSGLSEGINRVNKTVEKAAQIGRDVGIEEGLEALRCQHKKGGC